MSPQPPYNKKSSPPASGGNHNAPKRVHRPEDFGFESEESRKRRKREASLKKRVYRMVFPVGMVVGGFLSLLLPIKPIYTTISGHPFKIRTVGWLNVPERVALYTVIVVASGFFWAKQVSEFVDRRFEQQRRNDELYEKDYQTLDPTGTVFNLDDE